LKIGGSVLRASHVNLEVHVHKLEHQMQPIPSLKHISQTASDNLQSGQFIFAQQTPPQPNNKPSGAVCDEG
jgi:hypothetical protein